MTHRYLTSPLTAVLSHKCNHHIEKVMPMPLSQAFSLHCGIFSGQNILYKFQALNFEHLNKTANAGRFRAQPWSFQGICWLQEKYRTMLSLSFKKHLWSKTSKKLKILIFLKCSSVCFLCQLDIFWVCWTKQALWRTHFVLWELVISIFHSHVLTFHRLNNTLKCSIRIVLAHSTVSIHI